MAKKNVGIDHAASRYWFSKAAAQGHLEATRMAAVTARVVDGDAIAQYELGRKFEEGREAPMSPYDAVTWYTKSAEQGYVEAQFELGMMTRYNFDKIPQDITATSAWLQIAADAGHVEAGVELEKLKADILRQEDREAEATIRAIEQMIKTIKNRDK